MYTCHMSTFQKIGYFLLRCIKSFILGGAAVFGGFTAIIVVILMLVAIAAGTAAKAGDTAEKFSEKKLEYGSDDAKKTFLAIDVKGVIMGEPSAEDLASLFSEGITYGYDVKEQLAEAAKDKDIQGVILMVDSPGGTIFGSQAIADGVTAYRNKTGKPVIAYIGGMAASGAYWTSVSADEIIADHGTAAGSIGVIFGPFKYYDKVTAEDGGAFAGGVVTQGGIQTTYITAGRSKDVGNPYRKLTDQEIAAFQESVNDSYQEFVSWVSTRRSIPEDTIKNQLGALIYGEKQALKYHLIDKIGNKEDAFTELALRAGITNTDFKVVKEQPKHGMLSTIFGALTHTGTPKVAASTCLLHSQVLAFHGDVNALCQ